MTELDRLHTCPLLPALEASDGDDYTLLNAMADWYQEEGMETVSEAVRWLVAKRRVVGKWGWNRYDAKPDSIPRLLHKKISVSTCEFPGYLDSRADSLKLLVMRWSRCTEEERVKLWKWEWELRPIHEGVQEDAL